MTSSIFTRHTTAQRLARVTRVVQVSALSLALGLAATCLLACGEGGKGEVKSLKDQVQTAYGNKDYRKGLELSQKGFAMAREIMGEDSNDTLYFAQAISENYERLHNPRAELGALKQEISLRAAAHQVEKKLQPRRTKLIQLAEESGDSLTAADQAVAIARGIKMGPEKTPQPVYQTQTAYPADQYRQKVEGDVQVGFGLDASGKVIGARVIKATPSQVFDDAALESFRKWRFTPMLDSTGQPVSVSGLMFTIAFRLGK